MEGVKMKGRGIPRICSPNIKHPPLPHPKIETNMYNERLNTYSIDLRTCFNAAMRNHIASNDL